MTATTLRQLMAFYCPCNQTPRMQRGLAAIATLPLGRDLGRPRTRGGGVKRLAYGTGLDLLQIQRQDARSVNPEPGLTARIGIARYPWHVLSGFAHHTNPGTEPASWGRLSKYEYTGDSPVLSPPRNVDNVCCGRRGLLS